MTTFRLFTGNQLENLSAALADVLSTPLSSPLQPEIFVVQSSGMERWISMEIARYRGISANNCFYFPNAFVYEILRKILVDVPEKSPFDPNIVTWKIMKLIPSCLEKPNFRKLKNYLEHIKGGLKLYQLSAMIADSFDQYLIFRPEMIFRWERGEEEYWQAELWRKLIKGCEKVHSAALLKSFIHMLENSMVDIADLPERVNIFGISALPKFHMDAFAAISRLTQVNLFLMNPCREYWGDIRSDREIKKKVHQKQYQRLDAEELYLKQGNSLLASMGTLGRDFFDLINEYNCEEIEMFDPPEENNLLTCIQSDILNLSERQNDAAGRMLITEGDDSIQFHSCHSPMREVEVLHNNLLALFEANPELTPGDILVMTPDIETYAPYIQAVFDLPAGDVKRIPFFIADRSVKNESQIIETFLAILDLFGGRYKASQVFAILECMNVRKKFGLEENDLKLIEKWIHRTRIKWGVDIRNRENLGLPKFKENTWEAGLERLLVGYAMSGDGINMFADILPYDLIEGKETETLGDFIECIEKLFKTTQSLGKPRRLKEWSEFLTELLDGFFLPDKDTEREIQFIRKTLNNLNDVKERSSFDEEVDIQVIRNVLSGCFENEGFGFGFISGGVTFCAMLPMRSIPFKVICLIGLNSDAYPRQTRFLGFDLMAKSPRPGDRSRRNDDRYLFLESMLSARETLYISYVGQSIQDNSFIPPSVLVSELMDYIEEGFEISDKNIADHLVTMHRLQPFSSAYFKSNEKLFSYSQDNFQAAQRLLKERKMPGAFISRDLPAPEEEWKTIEIAELCRFFKNPAKYLINKRLGIYFEEPISLFDDREPFELRGLDQYLFEQDLVKKRTAGLDLKKCLPNAKAEGLLPHGNVGSSVFEQMSQGVERFTGKIIPYMQSNVLKPLEIDFAVSGFRLFGKIDSIYQQHMLRYRYAIIKAKDIIELWICHLALNCIRPDHYPALSLLAGLKDKKAGWCAWEYTPVTESGVMLARLLEIYWKGMSIPLKFFPESSLTYARAMIEKNKSPEEARMLAQNKWTGNEYFPGESDDAYYQLCFDYTDPIDTDFEQIAMDVFEPVLKHQKTRNDQNCRI